MVVDYKKFLGKTETLVLPYLGGMSVSSARQSYRLAEPPDAPGWFSFSVKGRNATALDVAEPEEMESCDKVTGHLLGRHLVISGDRSEEVLLLPEDEPPVFALCAARRWFSGELVFEGLEFETEAEEAVRMASEEGKPIADIKGVPATLRAAFGFFVAKKVSRELEVPFRPVELKKHALEFAEEGEPAARRALAELSRARQEEQARVELHERTRVARELAQQRRQELDELGPVRRAELALDNAGARMLSSRRLAGDQLEVVYRFRGERFESIVDAGTLQVIDAGFCLQGHDGRLTLESLPSAIKEAMEEDILHITRGWDY